MKQIISLAASLMLIGAANAGDWAVWRGPDNNGISTEKVDLKSLSSPKIAWQKELGDGYASVGVKGDKLYSMGYKDGKDSIYCLNAKTGKEIWKYSYKEEKGGTYKGPRATPVIDEGLVYTQSLSGKVHCLDAKSGKVKWESNFADFGGENLRWFYAGSAVIYGDMVIYNANKHGVALNKKTGKKVWTSPGGKSNYATPYLFKINGKDAFAIFGEKAIYAVDPKNGKKLWSFDWETKYDINAADPIVDGKRMFISSGYGNGGAMLEFSSSSVKTIWETKEMQNQFDSSVLIGSYIYGINGRNGKKSLVTCIDWKSGKTKWAQKIGGYGALSAVNDTLIFLMEKGDLFAVKATPSGYKEVATKEDLLDGQKCWIAPVLANGILYCKSNEGRLLAIDVR